MKYTVYKLGRKQETENPMPSRVYNGKQFSGATIRTMKMVHHILIINNSAVKFWNVTATMFVLRLKIVSSWGIRSN